jgi:hypothetical protein
MSIKEIKPTFLIILITVIFFVIITLLTHKNQLAVDGILTYGFPFSFYEQCGDCVPGLEQGFRIEYFILDFVIIAFFTFLIFHFHKKLRISKYEK